MFRSRAERKVEEAGYDPARLPPGQYLTEKWPVLHAGDVPSYTPGLAGWDFRVYGEVERPLTLTWDELDELPRETVVQDIHCVTRWSRFDMEWEGVSVDELIALAGGLAADARFVIAETFEGYTTNLPVADVINNKALVATHADHEPLTPEHGGPARLFVPHLYFWKSAKWIARLTFSKEDHLGFWERNGYHRYGDPFKEERYSDY